MQLSQGFLPGKYRMGLYRFLMVPPDSFFPFHSVRPADSSPIHYSLFSLIYYLTPPLAPSDEGAVNGVDWGRDCSVFSRNIWEYRNIFSPSGPSGHLPHQREAWVSASLHAGGIPHQREAWGSAFRHAGGTPHQREAGVSASPSGGRSSSSTRRMASSSGSPSFKEGMPGRSGGSGGFSRHSPRASQLLRLGTYC